MDRVVKNEGMPVSRAPGQKGDMRIKMNVQFPSKQACSVSAPLSLQVSFLSCVAHSGAHRPEWQVMLSLC